MRHPRTQLEDQDQKESSQRQGEVAQIFGGQNQKNQVGKYCAKHEKPFSFFSFITERRKPATAIVRQKPRISDKRILQSGKFTYNGQVRGTFIKSFHFVESAVCQRISPEKRGLFMDSDNRQTKVIKAQEATRQQALKQPEKLAGKPSAALAPDARATALEASLIAHMRASYGIELNEASNYEFWFALSEAVMEKLAPNWTDTRKTYRQGKQTHYLSAEFLVGRSLVNNLVNLDLFDAAKDVAAKYHFDLSALEEAETDPGLGNGGLGRLAACFLDSCANLNYPVSGYGIMYRYGLFKQSFEDGFQVEHPDPWMELPYPFVCRREAKSCLVHYQDMDVLAIPYDLPISSYHADNINVLRLWKPEPVEAFDYNLFNSQRFDEAVIVQNRVMDINRVLYPNDSTYDGKVLRVRQQYFFVSATLQYVLRDFLQHQNGQLRDFPKYHCFQLNDTHPVLAIPELMRLLMDEHGLNFHEAWEITRQSVSYTNHTTLAEALERWDVSIFQFLFPRIYEIITEIDRHFREEASQRGLDPGEIQYLSPLHDGQIHMAWLACYASYKINGVAEIHTEILKRETLHGFYKLYPERFNNKTNGVTPRRWLRVCNPRLSGLLTELSGGDKWVKDLSLLGQLDHYADDAAVIDRVNQIKAANKADFASFLEKRYGFIVDPSSVYDVQVKRLHEYKRQLLNILEILDRYFRIKEGAELSRTPVSYIFGAKSAPAYYRAKSIIKMINEVAKLVDEDPQVRDLMRVFFIPNYNVSLGEKIFPAAEISEQISTVGKEASGTSNMKFMMNGALTLGTYDGANLEISAAVGEENAFMFGPRLENFPATLNYYNSRWQYENITGLKRVVDCLINGSLSDHGTEMFRDLYRSLLQGNPNEKADMYYVLGDFDEYRKRRRDAHNAYADQAKWGRSAFLNIVRSGKFSSDRTIEEYAKDIWGIVPMPMDASLQFPPLDGSGKRL